MGGDVPWLERLAYGLRVASGWSAAVWWLLILLRQGDWNARVLRRWQTQMFLAGIPAARRRTGLITTPLTCYCRVLRAIPGVAENHSAEWEHRLHSLHDEVREASDRNPGPRKLLTDHEARELQRDVLRRFFQVRLQLELPGPADAFVRYRHSSEALRDFFDFCAAGGRLTSREEVERAMEDFARAAAEYRVLHRGQNPPQGYFQTAEHVRRQFWTRTMRLLQPSRLLTEVYWGKPHPQRVVEGVALPAWVRRHLAQLIRPPGLPRHLLRSVLAYEIALQGVRLLAEKCSGRASFPESAKVAHLVEEAVGDLLGGVRAPAAGWRPHGWSGWR